MQKKPDTKKIGLFVLAGFGFLALVLISFLHNKLFPGNQLVVMNFEESIKGLNIGAPVIFQGVEVGKVTNIGLTTDMENLDFSVSVYANIETANRFIFNGDWDREEVLDELIKKGLRARLVSQSFLTGQLMVEFVLLPDTKAVFRNTNLDDDDPEIPTVMSQMGELSEGLRGLHLKENSEKVTKILDELEKEIVPRTKEMLVHINDILKDNKNTVADSINRFNSTMMSFSQGAKSFRNFADYIERHPEAILKGKGNADE